MRISKLVAVLLFGFALQAEACPEFLKTLKTLHLPSELPDLCSAYDRYHAALGKIEAQGLTPASRVADLHARRMINTPSWESKREKFNYNPWLVYDPAPLTWQRFEIAAGVIDRAAEKNLSAQRMTPLDFRMFFKIHIAEMKELSTKAGFVRRAPEAGLSIMKEYAITKKQAGVLQASEYPSLVLKDKPLMQWHATQCLEERDPEFIQRIKDDLANARGFNLSEWPEIDKDTFYTDNGVEKQCGYLIYADQIEVRAQLKKWLSEINSLIMTWGTSKPQGDPIRLAARAQKWLIAIHPFVDGNGRMSRLVTDLLLRSLGLPSPVLTDHDDDIYSSEEEWAQETGRGILRSIQIAEKCANDVRLPECQVVSLTPPAISSGK